MSETRAPNFQDADLLLRLYDLRREAKLREARDWMGGFYPDSAQELFDAYMNPTHNFLRMVSGYWEMAATLVNQGVIHRGLFAELSGEAFFTWAKIGEHVPGYREMSGNAAFLANLERFIDETPGGRERVAGMRAYQKKIRALRESKKKAPVRKKRRSR